jgi:general secretion pathway protein H
MVRTPTWGIGKDQSVGVENVASPTAFFQAGRVKGFTLLELVVAIGIVALVLGVSAPSMQRLYQSAQYHRAVNDVVTLLSSARYSAIRKGRNEDVLINPETRIIVVGKKEQQLPKNLQVEVLGARELNRGGAGVIRFYADGSSSGGYVKLQNDSGMGVQVEVDWLLGRVTLCHEDCGDPINTAEL